MTTVGEPAAAAVPLVELDAIRAAAERLRGVIVHTPLVPFGPPAARQFLKAESLQPIGAFKLRGAYATIASLSPEERGRGVITYSSGNHAQGVARAASLLGIPAVVVMPSDAPRIKRERVEADGAEIVTVGTSSDERQRRGRVHRRGPRADRHPAVRRRPDHRRPGDDRPRARRGPARSRGRARADRRGRAGQRHRHRDQVPATGRPGRRCRARARRRRAGVASARRDRSLGRRARVADHRRRDADPGDRAADVPAPARAPRRHRDRHRGRDRGRRPARGRGEPAGRRTVRRPERGGPRVPVAGGGRGRAGWSRSSPWSAAATSTRIDTGSTWRPRSRRAAEARGERR